MIQKLPDLYMYVEVIGCPTTCQHCWAVGRPYQAMPLEDIAWVLHEVRRFCDAHDLTVDGYPMHEVAAHPQASQVMRLFHDVWNLVEEPVPTTGVPTVRNKTSGHGQGATPADVPEHLARYVLHMTASNIVFLVESAKATS